MITIFLENGEHKVFHDKKMALRFMYMMDKRGYFISGWSCDNPEDNEWLDKRFKI